MGINPAEYYFPAEGAGGVVGRGGEVVGAEGARGLRERGGRSGEAGGCYLRSLAAGAAGVRALTR